MATLDNANPLVFSKSKAREILPEEEDDSISDEIDSREIFDLLKNLNDPEHPLTLEELNVIQQAHIDVNDAENFVNVYFTPTIPHCSMATLIGLSIRVRLMRALPSRFKVQVMIREGTHASEQAINKQLSDKERVTAALENTHLLEVVNQCLNIKEDN